MIDTLEGWLATRPECIQKLAAEFPLGTVVHHDGKHLYLLGYNEDDSLILSEIDPHVDYQGANENKVYICAEHLREQFAALNTSQSKSNQGEAK